MCFGTRAHGAMYYDCTLAWQDKFMFVYAWYGDPVSFYVVDYSITINIVHIFYMYMEL